METIYERIRRLRQENNMSQDELAKKTGYTSRSTINKIEAGKIDISRAKIKVFADALGVTPGILNGMGRRIRARLLHRPRSSRIRRRAEDESGVKSIV